MPIHTFYTVLKLLPILCYTDSEHIHKDVLLMDSDQFSASDVIVAFVLFNLQVFLKVIYPRRYLWVGYPLTHPRMS